MKTQLLAKGTADEVRREQENRLAQGFDATVSGPCEDGTYELYGTPEDWYTEGHGVEDGSLN